MVAQHSEVTKIFNDHYQTRRGSLPEKAFIHTVKMTALKEINSREDKRWVIYKDPQSFMQSIEYNKKNHPILNQIYNILEELRAKDKKITL